MNLPDNSPLKRASFPPLVTLVIDTETTDFDGRLIELGWKNIDTLETFVQKYNPECKIEPAAMAVNHIIDAELVDQPLWSTASLPNNVKYVIGHYVEYDLRILKESGVDISEIKPICTKYLAQCAFPDMKSYTLGALIYALLDSQEKARELRLNAHSALPDVEMAHILFQLIQAKLGLHGLEDLHRLSESTRLASEKARAAKKKASKKPNTLVGLIVDHLVHKFAVRVRK